MKASLAKNENLNKEIARQDKQIEELNLKKAETDREIEQISSQINGFEKDKEEKLRSTE